MKETLAQSAMGTRTSELYAEMKDGIHSRTDYIFAGLMLAQWAFAILLAFFVSPRSWEGVESNVNLHVWSALILGGLISSMPVVLAFFRPGEALTRHTIAIAQILMSALLIHLNCGRIETHFHLFGSLAFLAFYRDWKVLITATFVAGLDHFLRGYYLPLSVFGEASVGAWRWLEHVGWVLFEDVFLIYSCLRAQSEMLEICARQSHLEKINATIEQTVQERTLELKAAQSQLLQSQKLEAIGQLASGVAHDFNNVLSGILAYASLLKEDYQADPVLAEGLQVIESSAERGAEMTQKLLAFARKAPSQGIKEMHKRSTVQLAEVIADAVALTRPLLGKNIQLEVYCNPDLCLTEGDSTQFFQVIMNLSMNARDAMPLGGSLKISAENTADFIHVQIADSGQGIPKELLGKIFEPFFTTKPPGSGTGLGLSMVYGIMQSHEGHITVESDSQPGPTQGTRFHLYFKRWSEVPVINKVG